MKYRPQRIVPPPLPGPGSAGFSEAISREEKAGRPVAPLIELRPSGPPVTITEAISREEKAGRPVAPLIEPRPVHLPNTNGDIPVPPAIRDEVGGVLASLRQLSPDARLLLEMRYFREMSIREIARSTKVSTETARARVGDARKQLRYYFQRIAPPRYVVAVLNLTSAWPTSRATRLRPPCIPLSSRHSSGRSPAK